MKKVLFYAFLLPAFVGMMFSCSDVKTDVKKLEGKWNIVEVKGEKILKETVENISQYLYNGYNVLGLSKEDQVQVLLKGDFIR